jgi:glyoxylase-like metal-dependent hydrolase (beta-lactamase superfamily II)
MFRMMFVLVALFASIATASAKPLEVEVLRTGPGSLFANITLIKGEKRAVLVDAPWTRADAHRVVAMILDSGLELETVFVTHDHPDHFFSMEVIAEAFPNARIVANPVVVADIWRSLPFKVKRWYPVMGANAPRHPTAPSPLEGDTIMLEGQQLKIIGPMQGDHAHATVVWLPDTKTLIAGDLVFNEVFPWLGEHSAADIAAWDKAINDMKALQPAVVVAGHSRDGLGNDPSSLDFMSRYFAAWHKAVPHSKDSKELAARITKAFPTTVDVLGDFLLGNSSRVAKGEQPAWQE